MHIQRLRDLKSKVEYCLREFEETRENDAQLTLSIIITYLPGEVKFLDGVYYFSMESLKVVREDHVKRIRAKLNQEGKYLPKDPEVIRRRNKAREAWDELLNE